MTEDKEYFQMLKRMLWRAGERAAAGDEIELQEMAEAVKAAQLALDRAVVGQLKAGKSYADVGKSLGVSKQYINKRYPSSLLSS